MKKARRGQRFRVAEGRYAVCRLGPRERMPAWADGAFVNVTRTPEELSVICPGECVPADVRAERDWRLVKLVGPFPFTAIGVQASIATPLAKAGISLLSIATYDTDYFLIKGDVLDEAVAALAAAGHERVD
jgi:hypothetical protein